MGGVQPGAMPWLSRVGNPLLSGFLNVLHGTNMRDAHCGMRAVRRDVLPVLNLRTVGMEFASEMVIRATREHLDVREVPIELHPRLGTSKLSPFRDGWRHLRAHPRLQPDVSLPHPWCRACSRSGLCSHAARVRAVADLRAWSLHPLADPGLSADHPRRPGDRVRAVRPCVRRLLHQRPGRALQTGAGAVPTRARAPAGDRHRRRRCRPVRHRGRAVGGERLRDTERVPARTWSERR